MTGCVAALRKKLGAVKQSSVATIHRVHDVFRRNNEIAYEPVIVAIGPNHHDKEHVQEMEEHKLMYLKSFLAREKKFSLTTIVADLKNMEEDARGCYATSTSHLSSDQFVELILVDACFLIELFYKVFTNDWNDHLLKQRWLLSRIRRDLLLLENQLPLTILVHLCAFTKKTCTNGKTIISMAVSFYSSIPVGPIQRGLPTTDMANVEFEHLLGIAHHIWSPRNPPARILSLGLIPSATELHNAGVKFKSKQENVDGNDYNPFSIQFCKRGGVMVVPTLTITDSTESYFRNMMAYEHYCLPNSEGWYFTNYVIFMDCLIDSPNDVALLRRHGIVDNRLRDDEIVSTMFNKLGHHIIGDSFYSVYAHNCRDVNVYYRKRKHRWMAKLRRDYFSNPWSFISLLAALFLLLFTFTQTIFTILSVV